MPDTNSGYQCIYSTIYTSDRCYVASEKGKICRGKSCKHFLAKEIKADTHTQEEEKYVWKSSMGLLTNLFDKIIRGEQHKFQKDREFVKSRHKVGHYPFIARSTAEIIEMIVRLCKHIGYDNIATTKFLDCGCGIGNVVLLATAAGLDAHGIEYDKRTLNKGHSIFRTFNAAPKRLFQGDLLEYNDFGKYDVLYGYCPMCDGKREWAFERRMMQQMKIGALLFGLYPGNIVRISESETVILQKISFGGVGWGAHNPVIKVKHIKKEV